LYDFEYDFEPSFDDWSPPLPDDFLTSTEYDFELSLDFCSSPPPCDVLELSLF
jgi:hypothetical protein